MISNLKNLFEWLAKTPPFNTMRPVIKATEAALAGSDETTLRAPHCVDGLDLKRYMLFVIIALAPTTLFAIHSYGLRMLAIIMVSYTAGGLVEVLFAVIRKHEIHEGFLVTGLIFPLTLPPTVPLWVVAVGVVAGTLFGKEMFGGTGRNIFNPALVGRLFITIAFPAVMSTAWQVPYVDTITSATPLGVYKATQEMPALFDLFIGRTAGSIGEGCRVGILLGAIFLIVSRVSDWRIPVAFLGSILALSAVGHHFLPARVGPPLFQLLSGGLFYGAFFMATDPVTSPFSLAGKWVFGILCGLSTWLIRCFSGYNEGVMFSIVLMNAFAPLIDQIVLRFKYGALKAVPAPSPAAPSDGEIA